jgi:hypothetical protein
MSKNKKPLSGFLPFMKPHRLPLFFPAPLFIGLVKSFGALVEKSQATVI